MIFHCIRDRINPLLVEYHSFVVSMCKKKYNAIEIEIARYEVSSHTLGLESGLTSDDFKFFLGGLLILMQPPSVLYIVTRSDVAFVSPLPVTYLAARPSHILGIKFIKKVLLF